MCKVCTEAVHCVALWTRVTLQVWTCVKYVPKQSIAQRFEHVCKCKRLSSSPPHPTPIPCDVCAGDSRWKNDAKLCLCVLVTPVCVRGWLWKMAVCARDSSLCARVTLENGCVRTWLQSVCAGDSGRKKMIQNCACVYLWLQSVCARVTPWPIIPCDWALSEDFSLLSSNLSKSKIWFANSLFCWEGIDWLQDFFLHGRLSNWPLIGEVTTRLLYQQASNPEMHNKTSKKPRRFVWKECLRWLKSCTATKYVSWSKVLSSNSTNHFCYQSLIWNHIHLNLSSVQKSWLFAVCKDYFISQYKIL